MRLCAQDKMVHVFSFGSRLTRHEGPRKNDLFAGKQDLLLLLDLVDDFNVNLQHIRDSISRGQGEPLSQRDIGDTVALVQFDPNELFGLRGIFNVVAWE